MTVAYKGCVQDRPRLVILCCGTTKMQEYSFMDVHYNTIHTQSIYHASDISCETTSSYCSYGLQSDYICLPGIVE